MAIKRIVFLVLATLMMPVYAETITLPVASQGEYLGDIPKPKTGESQAQLLERFGEPQSKTAAKGEPPISRWDYENFSVYFENTTVIHSVLKHRRLDRLDNNTSDQRN